MPLGSSSQHRRDRARSRSRSRDRSYERREKNRSFYSRGRDDSYDRHRSAGLAKSSLSQQKEVSDASGLADLTRNLEKSQSQRKDQIREETKKTFSPYATSSTNKQVKGKL